LLPRMACIFFLSEFLTIFSPYDLWLEWGIFFFILVTVHLCLLFVKFSKMANFNFRESWFGFFLFSEIRDQKKYINWYLETQKKYISMKNSQFFNYLLYAKSK
jgi:cell division protein FtsW (lipid II flippase)